MELWGGGGVKQLELYSGTDAISAITGSTNYSLSDSTTNFDYLVVKIIANEVDSQTEKLILVDASSTKTQEYSGNAQALENYRFNGWFVITNPTTLTFALRYRGADINSVCLASVVGIKYIDPDIKNATSLDETLLYSGTTDVPLDTNGEVPISNLNDYDYVLVKICGIYNSVDATTYSIEKLIKLPNDTVNNFSYAWGSDNTITFNGWIMTTNNKITVGLRTRGSSLRTVYIASIIGYKSNSLSTADIAEMAMPSNVRITIPTSSWTATANGEVRYHTYKNSTALSGSVLKVNGNIVYCYVSSAPSGTSNIFSKFVKKGDTILLETTESVDFSLFFYSVGDAKALGLL